jgi:hypothetical protein
MRPEATDLGLMKAKSASGARPYKRQNPPKPIDTLSHVAAAPGLLDLDHSVIREPDDTDADYESRCRLLAAALDRARKG